MSLHAPNVLCRLTVRLPAKVYSTEEFMFGQNKLDSASGAYDGTYQVQEIFHTIQGEGPFAGQPAVFIRMAGCNLRCHFCDTDFESKRRQVTIVELIKEVMAVCERRTKLIVITGGEPLLQEVGPLVDELYGCGFHVQFETAGTVFPVSLRSIPAAYYTLVCSPKTPKIHPEIAARCVHFKYIVRANDETTAGGFPVTNTQQPDGHRATLYIPPDRNSATIWMQPCEEYMNIVTRSPATELRTDVRLSTDLVESRRVSDSVANELNLQRAIRLCLQHGHRFSLQVHKVIGLP